MAGLGCSINGKVVNFDDMTPEAWGRVNSIANKVILHTDTNGNDVRATWLDVYANPMRDPLAARAVHEEAVRVAEPDANPIIRSLELAPNIMAVNESFTVVEDELPKSFVDGRPLDEDDPSTSS